MSKNIKYKHMIKIWLLVTSPEEHFDDKPFRIYGFLFLHIDEHNENCQCIISHDFRL